MTGGDASTDEFTPATADELAEFLAENAHRPRRPVVAAGGRTGLFYGYPPPELAAAVSTCRLSAPIDYPARDMTVTVQAGMTVEALTALLRSEDQQLPIDIPHPDRATIGGVLATNVGGPRRFGYGTLRDYLIGVTAVDGLGRVFHAGGRVVKNVAGYDLCKLLVGSLGTLAVITEATFKLRPIPAESRLLWGTYGTWEAVDAALARLLTSDARPVIVEALSVAGARHVAAAGGVDIAATGPALVLGVEGAEADVAWQIDRLKDELTPFSPRTLDVVPGDAAPRLLQSLTAAAVDETPPLVFRANLLPSRTVEFLQASEDSGVAVFAHAANGVVVGHLPQEVASAAEAETRLGSLRRLARAARGNLVIVRCPAEWKRTQPVFGEPEPSWPLMLKVKEALDPHRLLSPGRFVDGSLGRT